MRLILALNIVFYLVLGIFLKSTFFDEGSRILEENEVPAAVLQTFNTSFPEARNLLYKRKTANHQTLYRIYFDHHGHRAEAVLVQSGSLWEFKENLSPEELPESIFKEIARDYLSFTIHKAQKITRENQSFFRIRLTRSAGQEQQRIDLQYPIDPSQYQKG